MEGRILPITAAILERRINNSREEALVAKEMGADDPGGDGYHDEFFLLQEREFELKQIIANQAADSLRNASLIAPPEQFKIIELGHAITVKFLNDPWVEADSTIIHLVSTGDIQGFSNFLEKNRGLKVVYDNGNSSMLVSVDTPLGNALLGKERGALVSYTGKDDEGDDFTYMLKVLPEEEAIGTSGLFYLEP